MRTNSRDIMGNPREVAEDHLAQSLHGWQRDLHRSEISSSQDEIILNMVVEDQEEDNTQLHRCVERRICGIDNFVVVFCCIWPFIFIGAFLLVLFLFSNKS
tara:strand:- start:444 stop:746 length:303 start_codon:yes stop_codon:yes gene_type:complete